MGEPYFHCPLCRQEYSRYETENLLAAKKQRVESAISELVRLEQRRLELSNLIALAQTSPKSTDPSCRIITGSDLHLNRLG